MNQKNQPEALRLANWCEANSSGAYRASSQAASELRRQYFALNEWFEKTQWVQKAVQPRELGMHNADILRTRIESLQDELVAEAARTAEEKLRADQMTEQHRMQSNMRAQLESENLQIAMEGLANRDRIADLEAQLSAIGAGGVESLRKRDMSKDEMEVIHSSLLDSAEIVQPSRESLQQTAELTRLEACDALLQAAHAFFASERANGMHGAVKWLQGDDGSLVIFTRGEYKDRLMKVIGGDEDAPHAFDAALQAAPPAPAAVAVPEGWRLVPVRPTVRMVMAASSIDPVHESTWAAYLSAAPTPSLSVDSMDALSWGASAAETLLSIGNAIDFGRAQQILGEQWEAKHDCAPRGQMGVTVKDRPAQEHATQLAGQGQEHDTEDEQRWPNALTPASVAQASVAPLDKSEFNRGFNAATCVALQVLRGAGDAGSSSWNEICSAAGRAEIENYAKNIAPENWKLCGFAQLDAARSAQGGAA